MPRRSLRREVQGDLANAATLAVASTPPQPQPDVASLRFDADCLLFSRLCHTQLLTIITLLPTDATPRQHYDDLETLSLIALLASYQAALLTYCVTSHELTAMDDVNQLMTSQHHQLLSVIAEAYRRLQQLRYVAPRVPRGRKYLKELLFVQVWMETDSTFSQVVSLFPYTLVESISRQIPLPCHCTNLTDRLFPFTLVDSITVPNTPHLSLYRLR